MKNEEYNFNPVRWFPRGLGSDHSPGCFCCPYSKPDLYGNVSAFVGSKEDGERAVEIIGHGARLDYRPHEPQWIQVKVGACARHLWALEILDQQWYIGADPIERLRQRVAGRDQLEDEGHLVRFDK